MKVERVKYVIWAADMSRAVRFYRDVLGGEVVKKSEIISEVVISGATIAIHSGGDGNRTWTGLSFQVPDGYRCVLRGTFVQTVHISRKASRGFVGKQLENL